MSTDLHNWLNENIDMCISWVWLVIGLINKVSFFLKILISGTKDLPVAKLCFKCAFQNNFHIVMSASKVKQTFPKFLLQKSACTSMSAGVGGSGVKAHSTHFRTNFPLFKCIKNSYYCINRSYNFPCKSLIKGCIVQKRQKSHKKILCYHEVYARNFREQKVFSGYLVTHKTIWGWHLVTQMY